jgi:hypothetical protein
MLTRKAVCVLLRPGGSMRRIAAVAALSLFALTASIDRVAAALVVSIDKSSQHMTVLVDGAARHTWLVSTGTGGGPPSGTYRPQRMERKWYSRKFNWSPMPHAIFFHEGYAIHGTGYVARLGSRASHGCIRLHPANAAILYSLVQSQGMQNTRIVVANSPSMIAKLKSQSVRARLLHRPDREPVKAQARAPLAMPSVQAVPAASEALPVPAAPEKL